MICGTDSIKMFDYLTTYKYLVVKENKNTNEKAVENILLYI